MDADPVLSTVFLLFKRPTKIISLINPASSNVAKCNVCLSVKDGERLGKEEQVITCTSKEQESLSPILNDNSVILKVKET